MKKILTILCLFIVYFAKAQQVNVPYNPSKHVVVNDAVSPAQATPIDGRMMYFDTTLFLWRAFKDTTEVRLVLSGLPNKYRFGNSIIVVDSGGTLQSNGTFLNPHNTFWMYRDSTTDGALRKLWLFNDNPLLYTGLAPVHVTGTVISVDTGILATKYFVTSQGFLTNINGLIQAGTNITITGSGSSISPYVINSSSGSGTLSSVGLTMPTAFNVANSPLTSNGTIAVTGAGTTGQYIRGDGTLATFPALFNPIAGLGIVLTGTYPNITFAVDTSQHLDTVFAKYPLYVPPGTPDSVAIYLSSAHQQGALDSLDWVTFNNKQNAILFNNGSAFLESAGWYDTLYAGTNVTFDTLNHRITINASSSTALQAKLTWVNSSNVPYAGAGVITAVRLNTGLIGTFHSTDTLDVQVQKDTLFLKYIGLAGVGYDSTIWTGGSSDTFYSPRLHDSTGIKHGFDVNGNLYFMATGAVPIAINGDTSINGAIQLGSYLTKTDTITETANHSLKIIDSSSANTALQIVVNNSVNSSALSLINNASSNANVMQVTNLGTQAGIASTVSNTSGAASFLGNSNSTTNPSFDGTGAFMGGRFTTTSTGATNASAVFATASHGIAVPAFIGVVQDTSAATVDVVSQFRRTTSTSPTAGIGVEQDWYISSVSNANPGLVAVKQKAISTNTTDATFTGQYNIAISNAGSFPATDQFILSGNGELELNGIPGLGLSTDTTTYKPVGMDASGNLRNMANWSLGGGGGGGNFVGRDSVQTYTSGATVTVTNGDNVLVVNPASPIASLTITLPTTWHTSNLVTIVFGGTITSGNPVITSLNIANGSGQTLVQAVNPNGGSYVSGNVIQYKLVGTSDYRIL